MDNAYILDQRDHIVEVCGEWDRFALENAGESACASAVIGQPLFKGIAGDAASSCGV